ncbi:unnamed protein product [Medioppia subpectinata]|uniref:Uncharacterized protein n=1 Tax=Medioppia subpectinata TaxID=1979941 RepID=A0A7R9LXR5_9ACAR|nr:unnamed protein product [Medioppia subpectinata]CAG2122369.1 unnamed protein product [Medioppia subpectinata]
MSTTEQISKITPSVTIRPSISRHCRLVLHCQRVISVCRRKSGLTAVGVIRSTVAPTATTGNARSGSLKTARQPSKRAPSRALPMLAQPLRPTLPTHSIHRASYLQTTVISNQTLSLCPAISAPRTQTRPLHRAVPALA